MANAHGDFIWYELMTSDVAAAGEFYAAVLGWKRRVFDHVSGYEIFAMDGEDVAGLMVIPEQAASCGMKPGWFGYVGVDDVDATVSDILAAGGKQHMPPTDIPDVGRVAMLADPQGAMFYVMRGAVDGTSTSFAPMKSGHCHWNELATSDPAAALNFYRGRFDWEKGDAMPMGGMGDYQLLTHHEEAFGAVMRGQSAGQPPMWTYYFGVADIDAATNAAMGKGATVHYGPAEVPGGVFITVASDPQGASFGVVGPRKP